MCIAYINMPLPVLFHPLATFININIDCPFRFHKALKKKKLFTIHTPAFS